MALLLLCTKNLSLESMFPWPFFFFFNVFPVHLPGRIAGHIKRKNEPAVAHRLHEGNPTWAMLRLLSKWPESGARQPQCPRASLLRGSRCRKWIKDGEKKAAAVSTGVQMGGAGQASQPWQRDAGSIPVECSSSTLRTGWQRAPGPGCARG